MAYGFDVKADETQSSLKDVSVAYSGNGKCMIYENNLVLLGKLT